MCESQVMFVDNTPHCEKCLLSAFEWPADNAEFCDICTGKEYCEMTQTFIEIPTEAIWIKEEEEESAEEPPNKKRKN